MIGVLCTSLGGPRWALSPLNWIAPVFFLATCRAIENRVGWFVLLGALTLGHCLQCVAFATPPVPVIAVIGFGPPLAALRFLALWTGEVVRRRTSENMGTLAYVCATVALEHAGYTYTELGAWMATASGQVHGLAFLQGLSVVGLAGLGALMAWTSAILARLLVEGWTGSAVVQLSLSSVVTFVAIVWGQHRLSESLAGPMARVASVSTQVGPDESGLPSRAVMERTEETLLSLSRKAAEQGARLIVWNELALILSPDGEKNLLRKARALARKHAVDLVVAYAVLREARDPLFDNKYVFIGASGAILEEYQKHHPVPGEPSIRGKAPLVVHTRPYGRVAGAICYDLDFPALSRAYARQGVDLVFVPASDWRGIDPIHTLMARSRAIENGFALLRSTRWGPSAIYDRYGRPWGFAEANGKSAGLLIASVPLRGETTPAVSLGDFPVGFCWSALLILSFRTFSRRSPRAALSARGHPIPRKESHPPHAERSA